MTATMHYVKPSNKIKKPVLKEAITALLNEYFDSLKGEKPENVYNLVLTEVEYPLIVAVMKFTNNNQSHAALVLGEHKKVRGIMQLSVKLMASFHSCLFSTPGTSVQNASPNLH